MRLAYLLPILLAVPAHAQQCAPRADVVAGLAANYAETPRLMGIAGVQMMEVFASDTGTWTITVTSPEGVTCLVASGVAFRASPQGVAG